MKTFGFPDDSRLPGLDITVSDVIVDDEFIHKANLIKWELLKATSNSNNQEIKKEINNFALQLLHYDVKITAGGFFTLDLPLIFGFVGAGCTYIVILVQFDLSFS
ncbi:hypothetical protein RN001_001792 [Aquatica leii]|uniref:Uncharacterized protein n=1 Tax=Aquatica leii TaxID=1421715 RepID=A0AAN7PLL5_9COLE|nr:hypothetical protein RN001_001792 [Aquatica leii]